MVVELFPQLRWSVCKNIWFWRSWIISEPPGESVNLRLVWRHQLQCYGVFQSVAGVEFTHVSLLGCWKPPHIWWAAAEPECSEQCCFVGEKIFNLDGFFFCFLIDIQPLEVTDFFIIAVHPSAELHSCLLSSGKRKKKDFRAILFFFPPSSRLHQEVWYKKLVKPTVATLLSVREVRREEAQARRGELWKTGAVLHFSCFSTLRTGEMLLEQ